MISINQNDLKGTTMKIPQGEDRLNMLRWAYKNGEPVRAHKGFLTVGLTTGKKTGYVGGMKRTSDRNAFENKNTFDVAYIKSMVDDDILDVMDYSRAYYDEFYQVAFVSDYKITEGLTFTTMLGYLQPEASSKAKGVEDDASYGVNFMVQYDF